MENIVYNGVNTNYNTRKTGNHFMKTLKTCLLSLAFAAIALPALAQTPASPTGGPSSELRLTTSPLPINLSVTPGTSVTTPIKIKNDGNQTEQLKATLMKFKADPTTGAAILSEREAADAYFDWVTFSDPTFSIDPGEWKTENVTFNVPATAAFDYYYAIVFFRADQQTPQGTNQTILNGGTATLVLLTANVPGAKKELSIDNFTVNKNIFEFLPATFNVKVQNTGNIHVIPHGNIFITRNGQDVATLDVNATQGSVLPASPRMFSTDWTDGFPVYQEKIDASGNKTTQLDWNWADASKLRWGKYTAKLVLVYDDGQRDVPLEGEVTFWVVPWRLGAYALLIIFVPSLIVYLLMKWRMKKLRKQYEK